MCGLVGVIGKITYNDKKMFDYMLKLDVVRGPHSTGVARVPIKGPLDVVKAVGTTWDLIKTKGDGYYNNKINSSIAGDYKVLIGHNRWATIGEVTEENAHPFISGNITGAHNGTLEDFSRRKLDDHNFYETDSECIMFNLDTNGTAETVGRLSGAWALTWYNNEDETFNILRNPERPLYFAWSKDGKRMYYASEHWMIYQASAKMNEPLKDDLVYSITADHHYSFPLEDLTKFGPDNFTKELLKGFVRPPFVYKAPVFRPYAPVKSNVVDFALKKSLGASSTDYKGWSARVGEEVQFKLTEVVDNSDKGVKPFYKAQTPGPDAAEVRIHSSAVVDLDAILTVKDAEVFIGRIKKVRRVAGSVYLILDPKSINIYSYVGEATAWDNLNHVDANKHSCMMPEKSGNVGLDAGGWAELLDAQESMEYYTPDGAVDKATFDKIMNGGCAWCCAVPQAAMHKDLLWISGQDFLCEDCSTNEIVTDYVAQYATVTSAKGN